MRAPHEAIVVVRRGPDFLILHRAGSYGDYWHLVAGGVDEGETAAAAAERELREEVALDVPVVDLERPFTYPLADETDAVRSRFPPDTAEVRVDAFLAEAPSGWEPALNEEHDAYRWCSVEAAESTLYWPEPRVLVRAVASASY